MAAIIRASKLVELLTQADASRTLNVKIIDGNLLGLGVDPSRPTYKIDLSNELLDRCANDDPAEIEELKHTAISGDATVSRRSGIYWFELMGQRIDCHSLKTLLSKALITLESIRPGTLEKLSRIKPRTRRIVARDRHDLFEQGHLVKQFSAPLSEGWWYGTNNSALETKTWLKKACRCARISWDAEMKLSI